ncbi:MAG: DAK2 domain-containing protein [Chloroflexi bacterium SZAS-1]|nr:DAK2 domain-containing protein [Chloroflexi bacterium SZAS-1]
MASADGLVALFEAMTRNIEQDQAHLNSIDQGDGDAGDNMASNFRLITNTLQQAIDQQGTTDIGQALSEAAQVLNQQGQGATAPIYAQGLFDAAQRLSGQTAFTMSDLLPLLEGLLQGTSKASGAQQGDGTLLDVLLPGIMSYIQAKRAGQSEMQSILNALLNLRRGSYGTAQSSNGYGSSKGTNTTGQIDPGAAGAASLLEGLFGALLRQAMQQGGGMLGGSSSPIPQPSTSSTSQDNAPGDMPLPLPKLPGGLGDLLGTLLGGAAPTSSKPAKSTGKRKYT